MTPEEIGQPTPSPEPAPAPPPPAPPEPAPAPPPEAAAEPAVDSNQFNAMASLLSRDTPSLDSLVGDAAPTTPRDRQPRPAAPVSPPPEAPSLPAQPAPEGPKRWGGAYDTPEALERAYKEVLDRSARTEQAAQRLERLLLASLEGRQAQPGQPPVPTPAPRPVTQWNQQSALTAIKEEAARLGLDDPQADPQRFIRAIAAALREDPEARGLYVEPAVYAIQQQAEQQRQIQTLQTAFYTQYPDLREVRPELLRQVAQETEARLYRANPEVYGSPEYVQQWFNETAREARAVFRVSPVSGTEGNGQASVPAQSQSPSKAPSEKPKGAPFSESPSPRQSEPTLSGQALHLARVFGRPG